MNGIKFDRIDSKVQLVSQLLQVSAPHGIVNGWGVFVIFAGDGKVWAIWDTFGLPATSPNAMEC
ncbi:MAG: hypothetical protein ABUS47_16090 [Steroidobacter sp.]